MFSSLTGLQLSEQSWGPCSWLPALLLAAPESLQARTRLTLDVPIHSITWHKQNHSHEEAEKKLLAVYLDLFSKITTTQHNAYLITPTRMETDLLYLSLPRQNKNHVPLQGRLLSSS